VLIALAIAFAARADPPVRKATFVNTTADHKHDRAVRSSARWFQDATGINLGIVFIDQLPRNVNGKLLRRELT